jgi:hypothetical protein
VAVISSGEIFVESCPSRCAITAFFGSNAALALSLVLAALTAFVR